jgi:uncharacterized protein (DUF1499 family)
MPLPPCPGTPNCVCSDDEGASHIAPLRLREEAPAAWEGLVLALTTQTGFTITSRGSHELRVMAKTPILGFIDDLIFQLRPELGEIAIRSESRIGYWDLGTNRRRLETLRRVLSAQGLIDRG